MYDVSHMIFTIFPCDISYRVPSSNNNVKNVQIARNLHCASCCLTFFRRTAGRPRQNVDPRALPVHLLCKWIVWPSTSPFYSLLYLIELALNLKIKSRVPMVRCRRYPGVDRKLLFLARTQLCQTTNQRPAVTIF